MQIVSMSNSYPVDDVEACIVGEPDMPCIESDDHGILDLRLPLGREVALRLTSPTHAEVIFLMPGFEEDTTYADPFGAATDLEADLIEATAPVPWDETRGGLLAMVYDRPNQPDRQFKEGVSLTLTPTGDASTLYLNSNWLFDETLSSTSASGTVFVLNLLPGEHVVRFEHPSADCHIELGWPTDQTGESRVYIEADWLTGVWVYCD
ncbi:MAG: hypothetical protein ABI333_26265 [bacterium]